MSYWLIFKQLVLYTFLTAPLVYIPTVLFGILKAKVTGFTLMIFAPIAGPLFSLPVLLFVSVIISVLYQRNVRNQVIYGLVGGLALSVLVGGILLVMGFPPLIALGQFFFAGLCTGLLFGRFVKKQDLRPVGVR